MAEEFSADIPSEGQTLDIDKAFERLEDKGDTTSSESQPEKKETAAPSQKGAEKTNTPAEQTPFHRHPRWIQTQKELKELREFREKAEKERNQSKSVVLPDWFKNQFGDTDEARKRYEQITQNGGELDWIKQQILSELDQRTQQEQKVIEDGENYVQTQLAEMKDEGLKFERNELLKFMVDFQNRYGSGALLDSEGNYDFRKSLELMNEMSPRSSAPNVAKTLAAQSGRAKPNVERSSKVPVVSARALRKGNWRDADSGRFIKN